MNNILMFRSDQHLHAQTFQQSLKGETALERVYGGGWQVRFPAQRKGAYTTFFAVLPDGIVVQRRSQRILTCAVAVIESSRFINEVRGTIWCDAEREYRLAQDTAKLPEPVGDNPVWAHARKIIAEFPYAAAYSHWKVEGRNLQAKWEAVSWRTANNLGRDYAAKLRTESRWGDVHLLVAVGGV